MIEILKIQRNGLITIPKEWRSAVYKEGQYVEAILREDGILLHPVEQRSARPPVKAGGWRACIGGVAPSIINKLQKTIQEEFSKINPEDWK